MEYTELLGKQLIPAMPHDRFVGVLSDTLDPPDTIIPGPARAFPEARRVLYPIGSTHYVVESDLGWSLFESVAETAWRTHVAAWADFARGWWTRTVPTQPGTYPVRDRSGNRGRDHVFVSRGDRVLDTDSGFLRPGVSTNYVGDFWSLPYPTLPGAK
jgi:hypothetical protein